MNVLSPVKQSERINLVPATGDIASPQDGDIWYNSTTGKFRKRENGSTSNLDTIGGGGGLTYTEVTSTSVSLTVNTGFIMNNASLVTGTLPSTGAVGDIIHIIGKGAGGWKIAQNSGQKIIFLDAVTLTGTSGYVSSNNRYDSVELMCIVANTEWLVKNSSGNITLLIS